MRLVIVFVFVMGSVVFALPNYVGYSSGPGRGTCANTCHGATGGTVQVSGFPTSYVPNATYLITISHLGGFSINNFNASCRIGTGTGNAGVLSAGEHTTTYDVPGETNGIHLSVISQDSAAFIWQAPTFGTGDVRLYTAALQGFTQAGPNTRILSIAQERIVTTVCGDIFGVWDSTGSPYYVTCDVTVPAGETLEIRPGVQVLFTGHYKFNVFGNLQAIGTEQDSIVFTRAYETEESKWWGIRIISAQDTTRLNYCRISYGLATGTGYDDTGGGIQCLSSPIIVSHCAIVHNWALRAGGGISFDDCSPIVNNCCVLQNESVNAAAGGIALWNCNGQITSCLIAKNFSGTTGGGLSIGPDGFSVTIRNCTIVSNIAINDHGGIQCLYGFNPNILDCVVWGNSGNQVCGNVTYSDIQGGYSGTGNISIDPQFVDAANGDFHLLATSPCIDVGDPNSPPDPDGTIADMGAFYYPHPAISATPLSLGWGLQDIGADSILIVSLSNVSVLAAPILAMYVESSSFTFDSTGLNGAVAPNSTFSLPVTFAPTFPGCYEDTLTIIAQSLNVDTLRIPLSGEARIIPLPVDSLVVKKGILNGMQLYWAAVTQTISGQVVTPDYYVIYGATAPAGPFVPVGGGVGNSFLHTFITQSQLKYFYRVTAVKE